MGVRLARVLVAAELVRLVRILGLAPFLTCRIPLQ
jgi:hypothetical protein